MSMDASAPLTVETVDYHTAGEPFRIVIDGVPSLRGETILERRAHAAEHLDRYRRLLVNEPRGHADMYGGYPTDPDDDGADLGVVFFHNAGYSTACGHGTIALVTWALEEGRLPAAEERTRVVVDVPSGRLETWARVDGERVRSVRFRNVPSFVQARDLEVETPAGAVSADVAYGGAFYASVRAEQVGLAVAPANVGGFVDLGRAIKEALNERGIAEHPADPRLSGVYGVIFFDELDSGEADLRQRNVTVFADGEVDRSPCGSGTSARLALLHSDGAIQAGQRMVHESIIGTRFDAGIAEETTIHGRPAVVTEVKGSASRTGRHRFELDPGDEVGTGFLLR